jgi:RNA polymerase sigma-70 factor (ECF subfamily)
LSKGQGSVLAETFLELVGEPARFGPLENLRRELEDRFAAGKHEWPGVGLTAAAYARWIAARADGGNLPDKALAADLFIACACASGAQGALTAFEARFGDLLSRAASRVDSSAAFVEDALQILRTKLFVPSAGSVPQITGYAGRAPLRTWLAAAAYRTALKLRRRKDDKGHDALRSDVALAPGRANPELEYMKERYGKEFEAAIRVAIGRLDAKDRALLRLHLAEGMSIDRLGALYKVGRSTAARWLAKARGALLEETRRELCERLGITFSEYESLAALVRSQLKISVAGYFERASSR